MRIVLWTSGCCVLEIVECLGSVAGHGDVE